MTPETNTKRAAKPEHLKLNFYSHATLECRDIAFTRRFFEEFLGFETVQLRTHLPEFRATGIDSDQGA